MGDKSTVEITVRSNGIKGIGQTIEEAVRNETNLFERQLGEKRDGDLDHARLRAVTDGLVGWPESFEKR